MSKSPKLINSSESHRRGKAEYLRSLVDELDYSAEEKKVLYRRLSSAIEQIKQYFCVLERFIHIT